MDNTASMDTMDMPYMVYSMDMHIHMAYATSLLVAKEIFCRMDMDYLFPILPMASIHSRTSPSQILFPMAFLSRRVYSKKYINFLPKFYINFSLLA